MLRKWWIELRSSLWFVPSLLVLGAVTGAFALLEIDLRFGHRLGAAAWRPLLGASADGARSMLAAIAGSMITVAGVAFSITIVTLSLASTQYTPRILRNFMRDPANQGVLGVFVGVFTYCLIILRGIRSPSEGQPFVPLLAVFVGVLLALLGIGCLIFFIHHVATSIQASHILSAIAAETTRAIDHLFPDDLDEESESRRTENTLDLIEWQPIHAARSGYVQVVNSSALIDLARKHDLLLRVERGAGDFAVEAAALICVSRPVEEALAGDLRRAIVIGDFRTVEQDAAFGFRQIVDIAMKALSPGVNDTSTAVTCLDYLAALLTRLANRSLVPQFLVQKEPQRVTAKMPSFAEFVAKSFDEIRLSAEGNVTIILQMLCALDPLLTVTQSTARREALLEQAQIIAELADRSVPAPYDRARINEQIAVLRTSIGVDGSQLAAISAVRVAHDL